MYREYHSDIAILGGGTGGCAAALAAARMGRSVIMTEETDWIGGQLTSQAVPPDEHPWIEQLGCTLSYRKFRNRVREYYKKNFPLTTEARSREYLNPGSAYVSNICHDPRISLAVLQDMLAQYICSGRVILLKRHKVEAAEVNGDKVISITARNIETGDFAVLTAEYFLDATECGDILPLANAEYVTGSESQCETGEPHALPGDPQPLDMQAVTWCFAMDYMEGENHTIKKPKDYDFWKRYKADFWPGCMLGWTGVSPVNLKPVEYSLFPADGQISLWLYRRITARENFVQGAFKSDVTLVNWPQNDYWLGPVYEVDEDEAKRHLEGAKQLSLSLLYWMQTEAPRPDGGAGYPGLRLRNDVTGTEDGLAKSVYIRESRRIKAEFTVLEQHLNPHVRGGKSAELYNDTVGIGSYRIDLHPSTGGRNYIDIEALPFQIPMGSLIPVRMENLLPACKNIGVTHITNGCYRLHPVEWNIGEAAGLLAAYCVSNGKKPRQVRNTAQLLQDFQNLLVMQGVELSWTRIP